MKKIKEISSRPSAFKIANDIFEENTIADYIGEIKINYCVLIKSFLKAKTSNEADVCDFAFNVISKQCEKLSALMGTEIGFEFDEERILVYTPNSIVLRLVREDYSMNLL